jgi:hypothetical protein
MYRPDQIAILATAFSEFTGIPLSALGRHATGNSKFFIGLVEGKDCRASNLLKAGQWFELNWPIALPWPERVPQKRRRPRVELPIGKPRTLSAVPKASVKS